MFGCFYKNLAKQYFINIAYFLAKNPFKRKS